MEVWIKTEGSDNGKKSSCGKIYWHLYRHFKYKCSRFMSDIFTCFVILHSTVVKKEKRQKKGTRTTGNVDIWEYMYYQNCKQQMGV